MHFRLQRGFFAGLAFFLWLLPPVLNAQELGPPMRLSLEECLDLASRNHAKINAQGYSVRAAEWKLNEAQARFWPVLEYKNRMAPVPKDASNAAEAFFSGDVTYFNSFRFGLGMPLHAFGQLMTAQKLARQGVQAAKAMREKETGEVRFDVKKLYHAILLGRELKAIAEDALRKIDNKLVKGDLSPYKKARLKVFRLDLERRLEEAYMKERLGKEAMRIQLGLEPDQPYELHGILTIERQQLAPLGYYLETVAEAHPNSRLVDIGVEAKRLELRLEKRKLAPRLGMGGFFEIGRTTGTIRNVSTTDDFSNPFNYTRAGFGLELAGTIDFHGTRARIKRLDSESYSATLQAGLAKRGIALEVEKAYREAFRAKEEIFKADQKMELSRQMVFLSKSNLEIGVGDEEEYGEALQIALEARGEYYKAVFDYNVALANLDWKTGINP